MIRKAKKRKVEQKKSGNELKWEEVDYNLLGELFSCSVQDRRYEPITFNLGGVKYTPDYSYVLSTDEMVFIEVKGSAFQAGYAYSKARLKMAASMFQMFHFVEALYSKGNWNLKLIDP